MKLEEAQVESMSLCTFAAVLLASDFHHSFCIRGRTSIRDG